MANKSKFYIDFSEKSLIYVFLNLTGFEMDTLRLDSLPPQQAVPQSRLAKRNSNNKTPSKNPKTPGKSTTPGKPKTPKTPGGDRFIPNRSTTNFQLSSFLLQERSLSNEGLSPMKQENQKIINDHFNIDPNTKILSFRDRAPQPIECLFIHIQISCKTQLTYLLQLSINLYKVQLLDRAV